MNNPSKWRSDLDFIIIANQLWLDDLEVANGCQSQYGTKKQNANTRLRLRYEGWQAAQT